MDKRKDKQWKLKLRPTSGADHSSRGRQASPIPLSTGGRGREGEGSYRGPHQIHGGGRYEADTMDQEKK